MKKKLIVLLLALTLGCTACAAGICASAETEPVPPSQQSESLTAPEKTGARSDDEEAKKHRVFASVCGQGRVTADADTAMLTFRIRVFSEDHEEGKRLLKEKESELFEAMRKVTQTTGESLTYEYCRPVSEGENDAYAFTANITAKIKEVSKTAEAKNAAVATGAAHLFTHYLLEEDSEAMNRALALAKEDAQQKATALLGDGTELKSIREEHCGWIGPSEEEGKVTVNATVRAKFIV